MRVQRMNVKLGLLVSVAVSAGCAALPPPEGSAPDPAAMSEIDTGFEQQGAASPLPPEVFAALFDCAERVDLSDLRLSQGEEGRVRRCLRAHQRTFMSATPLIVDWQVSALKELLAQHRNPAPPAARLARQTR